MTAISPDDFVTISKLQPEERFDYALATMVQQTHLWGLKGTEGWVLLKADEDACLPIWPSAEFANAWKKDDFPECAAQKIELSDWLEQWLPGMKKNGTLILVFPLSDDEEGIMLDAQEVLECFAEHSSV